MNNNTNTVTKLYYFSLKPVIDGDYIIAVGGREGYILGQKKKNK